MVVIVQTSWQAEHLVNLEVQISWQVQHLVNLEVFAGLTMGHGVQWGDMTILAGTFEGILSDAIMIDLGRFVEHVGFTFDDPTPSTLAIPGIADRALTFHVGDQIMCCGRICLVSPSTWKGDNNVTLFKRPLFDASAEWDFVHHFAGAFHGWGQAVNMIPKLNTTFRIGAQMSVDIDSVASHT